MPLCEAAWAEAGDAPFNPQLGIFGGLYDMGLMDIIYDDLSHPQWYALLLKEPNVFTGITEMNVLSVYVTPQKRRSKLFLKVYREIMRRAKESGCESVYFRIPASTSYAKAFQRLADSYDFYYKIKA